MNLFPYKKKVTTNVKGTPTHSYRVDSF